MFDKEEARKLYLKIKRGSFSEEDLQRYQAMKNTPEYRANAGYIEGQEN